MLKSLIYPTIGSSMNKVTFLSVFSLFCFLSQAQSPAFEKMISNFAAGFPAISTEDASKLIGSENTYFLDAREVAEFNVSHIQNAIFVGYDQVDWKKIESLPKDAQLIVYCSVGARSKNLAEKLEKKGYKNVKNLYGGLFKWANEERTMYNQKHEKTEKIHGYNKIWGKWITKGKVVYKD